MVMDQRKQPAPAGVRLEVAASFWFLILIKIKKPED